MDLRTRTQLWSTSVTIILIFLLALACSETAKAAVQGEPVNLISDPLDGEEHDDDEPLLLLLPTPSPRITGIPPSRNANWKGVFAIIVIVIVMMLVFLGCNIFWQVFGRKCDDYERRRLARRNEKVNNIMASERNV